MKPGFYFATRITKPTDVNPGAAICREPVEVVRGPSGEFLVKALCVYEGYPLSRYMDFVPAVESPEMAMSVA